MTEEITIKEVLHQTIEDIDDDKILYAAYTLLQKSRSHPLELSQEQLYILHERDEQYQAGKMKTYSHEELDIEMKRKYRFK